MTVPRKVVRRLLSAVVLVWAVTSLTFVVSHVLPSDPARMVAGPQARPADVDRIRRDLGLDRSLVTQYVQYVTRLVHAGPSGDASPKDPRHASCATFGALHVDLGTSFQQRRPVVTVLAARLPRTLWLGLAALVVQLVLGVGAGVLAASRRGTALDHGALVLSLLGVSTPTFLLGIGLQFVLAHKLRLLPLDGYGRTLAEHVASVVLPALTLGVFGAAYYTRLVRDEMLDVLHADHVRTARAKGLSQVAVITRHVLRNALLPLVTVVGMDLGALVGGAVVAEHLFRWPGIGALSVTAILDRDSPVIMGVVLVTSTAVVMCNLAVDLVYAMIDPRLRP